MYKTSYKSTSPSTQQTKAMIYVLICNFYTKYVTEEFEGTNFPSIAVLEISMNYIMSKYWFLMHWLQTNLYTL